MLAATASLDMTNTSSQSRNPITAESYDSRASTYWATLLRLTASLVVIVSPWNVPLRRATVAVPV